MEGFVQAIDLLNQAVARDPSFFDAYCQLAFAHDQFYFDGFDHSPARLALAKNAIDSAFRLKPESGEAHLARAVHLYRGYRDYDPALAELEIARQTLPNDVRIFRLMGYMQRRQGHWEQSIRNLERAADLDPRDLETLRALAVNYSRLERLAEAKMTLARAIAVKPDDVFTRLDLAWLQLAERADTRPFHQTIESIRATNPAATSLVADSWFMCALAERDAAAAKNALNAMSENQVFFNTDQVLFNRPFLEGLIARMTNDGGKAQSAFTAARLEQEKIVQAQPDYGPALCMLGLIDAGLGRKEEALREGWRAVEFLPVEKDAFVGKAMIKYFAVIAAWVGDKDLACEQLAIVLRPPSGISYGQLKLLPFWDPLRGDPRFEGIVASLASKK